MNVLVYHGAGVSPTSLAQALFSLRRLLSSNYAVETISASALASHPWAPSCALLVIPGGREVPYLASLSGRANESIKAYVNRGGSLLGLCAGAYYLSRRVEWEAGTKVEVVGDRPLGFYPGTSEGCVYKGFGYDTESGARAVTVGVEGRFDAAGEVLRGIYYNGGGHFVGADDLAAEDVAPLLRYPGEDGLPGKVAAITRSVGLGTVILSHVHLEYSLAQEPAASAIRKYFPSLEDAERASWEEARWDVMARMLHLLRLRFPPAPKWAPSPSAPSDVTSTPSPQYLLFAPGTPHGASELLAALESDLSSPARDQSAHRTLQDHNDTFHIYHVGSEPLHTPSSPLPCGTEVPASFPKTIFLGGPNDAVPEPAPHGFDAALYFRELVASQRQRRRRHGDTNPSRWRMGEILLYSTVVTSTQTLLDK